MWPTAMCSSMDFHQTLPPQPRYIRYLARYCYYFPYMLGQVRFRLGQIRAHDRQNVATAAMYSSMDFHQTLPPQPWYIQYIISNFPSILGGLLPKSEGRGNWLLSGHICRSNIFMQIIHFIILIYSSSLSHRLNYHITNSNRVPTSYEGVQ